jgi:serine/threonine protein kinase
MAHEEEEEAKRIVQYPLDPHSYEILDDASVGASPFVYKAVCPPMNSTMVSIKVIDLDQSNPPPLSHPNILSAHCSFPVGQRMWVVMPFMSGGSLQSIMASSFPDGLPEPCIAIIGIKADIWSFGITALELAHGRPPLSCPTPSKLKNLSEPFRDMLVSCLQQDPSKRPSTETLLKHRVFKNFKGSDFLAENVLQGLPSVEEIQERFKWLTTNNNGDD